MAVKIKQKINPFLWFDNNAETAVNFYISIFKNSKITGVTRYIAGSTGKEGSVMTVRFEIPGQEFVALNGGPVFKFTEAISFAVNCETQDEVDELWNRLSKSGQKGQCGWLKDKFGLSWQIFPVDLGTMLLDTDTSKTKRVMDALMKMRKLNINRLREAYDGK